VAREKAVVVASGSSNGVAVKRFLPTPENLFRAEQLRIKLNLPENIAVIGFVGRFTRDKGIAELIDAYEDLSSDYPAMRLLLVGNFEVGDPVPSGVRRRIEGNRNILRPGFVSDTSPYYHLMDVLVLPTYREGFPNVPLEAQAAGKPVVTTRATGAIDSVLDGETGLLVPVGDASALVSAIKSLLCDATLRKEMGRRGQEWVTREFTGDRVRAALLREYESLILERLGPNQGQVANGDAIEGNR
jgi:glycosyltransferase involved in cell wall biosynthesis